jgi:hypothetical protein
MPPRGYILDPTESDRSRNSKSSEDEDDDEAENDFVLGEALSSIGTCARNKASLDHPNNIANMKHGGGTT